MQIKSHGVYKRPESKSYYYYIIFDDYTQEKKSTKETTKSKALVVLNNRVRELSGKPKANSITINDLINDYEKFFESKREGDLPDWFPPIMKSLRSYFGDISAEKIKTKKVNDYIPYMLGTKYNKKKKKKGYAKGTVEKNLTYLNAIYNFAWRNDKIPEKALKQVKNRDRLVGNVRTGFLEQYQYKAILNKLPKPLKIPFKICYMYGLRKNECLSLTWDRVNNKAKTIRLEAIDTKTKAPRNIKLNDELNEDLRKLFQESMDKYGNPHSKYVFTIDNRGKLINNNYFYSEWEKTLKKCKSFSQEFVWSDTRRTAVRDMIRSGIPEKIVMQITGHKSRSIIDRYNIVNEEDFEIANEMRLAYFKKQEHDEPFTVDY